MKEFKNKVAAITGSATGIGRAFAEEAAKRGMRLALIDINTEGLEETKAICEKAGAPKVVTIKTDVTKYEEVRFSIQRVMQEYGQLDLMFANAGIASFSSFRELTAEQWRDMIDINLTGVFHTAKVAVPSMVDAEAGGSMVFTSSTAGLKGIPNIAHYVAAKHGIVGLMRTLANELGPHGIRVNTVHPTNVDTDMIHNRAARQLFTPPELEPTLENSIPALQSLHVLQVPWAETSDVSNAVAFLLSDEARYITGATLPVDAGATAR